ncbi:hypothetical protein TrLO_g1838 [Triparma laevis f. longispina]|uniref:F-box domain-containing protein n=1 Tax=Triparma laevis f. longispina TaxID=1714387 RepID=A0A9W7AD58_9STRA|nr:hypothetical protein TrLO_g1838 [Triparma laevis f. longispina]
MWHVMSSSGAQQLFEGLAAESRDKEEVSQVLSQVLLDVEYAHFLNLRNAQRAERNKFEQEREKFVRIINEYRALEKTQSAQTKSVADKFFIDFITFANNYELQTSQSSSSSSARVLELEKKLEEAERMLRSKERRLSNNVNANTLNEEKVESETNNEGEEEGGEEASTATTVTTSAASTPTPDTPPLQNLKLLDDTALFTVFSFLEAFDVLSCAQVDRTFFKRVDTLFGFGSSVNVEPSPPASSEPEPEEPSTSTPKRQQVTSAANSLLNRGLSLLNRTPNNNTPSDSKPSSIPPQPSSSSSSSSSSEPPLTSTFASSIADKLTANELKSIISLTERLKKTETNFKTLQSQNEDLTVRLDSALDVKEFLTNKVSGLEDQMVTSKREETLKSQQTKSDQEVIGFLDGRVRSLEIENGKLKEESEQALKEVSKTKNEKKKQLKILDDMLSFERTNAVLLQSEFKASKKVLVKEVKSVRATVTALRAERDSLRGELGSLREALNGREGRRSSLGT